MTTESNIKPIVGYGSPILRKVCVEAEDKAESHIVIQSLLMTVMSIGTAVGLAAPQINSDLRMFVMRLNDKSTVVVNPIIKKRRDSMGSDEACLSIPGIAARVAERNKIIDVEFYDHNFNKQKMRLRNYDAIVFQHEFDHINGVLYTDLLTKESAEAVKDKLSDIEKGIYKAPSYEMIFPETNITPLPKYEKTPMDIAVQKEYNKIINDTLTK